MLATSSFKHTITLTGLNLHVGRIPMLSYNVALVELHANIQ